MPVSGIAGDQQAALFGQACFTPGTSKNTYGTGSFVLVNLGAAHPPPVDGTAHHRGVDARLRGTYALEGSIFVTGAAIQWLRDGLGIIADASEAGPLAESVPTPTVSCSCPRSPDWARPTGTRVHGRAPRAHRGTHACAHRAAAVEAMAWQTVDVVDAITAASGTTVTELRVDGGASSMDVLCQFQADVLGVTVRRPVVRETTALGAALLAGLAEGVWSSPEEAASAWQEDAAFTPRPLPDFARRRADWHRGVDRARDWASDG